MNKTSLISLALLAAALLCSSCASVQTARPVLKSTTELDSMRLSYTSHPGSAATITKNADARLQAGEYTVVDKKKCISGNRHNYESMAIYYWPDPDNPGGKYIVKDGQANPEYNDYDGSKLFKLTYSCNDLAEAYYVTRDPKYADKLLRLLNTWFINDSTRMLPNMEYCQFLPGHNRHGMPGGISEAICFIDVVEDISILSDMGAIDKQTMKSLRQWFSEFATWMRTSEVGKRMSSQKDNLSIDYDILLYRLSMFSGEKAICEDIYRNFAGERLNKQFAEDGSQPNELLRARSYYYSIYNLQHVIDFCEMCELSNRHFYQENKDRIDRALNFLLQYVGHQDKYPYRQISDTWANLEKNILLQKQRLSKLQQR